MNAHRPHVVVIGGGLAGLSAAIACLDGGATVSLFEGRPRLGGATWSFERNGLTFDNGQHVHLRCCTAYRRFLERVGSGADAPLQERLSIPVLSPSPDGRAKTATIGRTRLPAPAHLLASLLGYSLLPLADRLRLGLAVRALTRLSLADPALDEETFASFLARHGQRPLAIERLWDLITLPTTNLHAAEVSLAVAAKVFKTGLLEESDAADLGWSRVPLSVLHGARAEAVLVRDGARVTRRAKVSAIALRAGDDTLADGVVVDGELVGADAVVSAVPHTAAAELLPPAAGKDPDELVALGASPIIDVHVVYDRRVTEHSVAAGVGTPVQFVFDRTEASGLDARHGQCLAVSVSGADAEHGERPELLIERYVGALGTLFPEARRAKVIDAVVSREHAATFRAVPGSASRRPGARTRVANLFLAGAWTDTGWPATMEGAVRSGNRAAWHALASVGLSGPALPVLEEVVA